MNDRIQKYIEAFREYVSNYDFSQDKIRLKYEHTIRVMELSRKYAKLLGFSEEDVELATLIGLLHDIGRFEQVRVYDSFDDLNTVDHADYSVEQLFNKGEIKRFTTREDWYPILAFAIRNHNKLTIKETDNERMLKHAKLIRDTDKMDIMVVMIGRVRVKDTSISPKVLEATKNHECANRKYAVTTSDRVAIYYGFAFDINYDVVLKEYKKNFTTFHESLDDKEKFQELYEDIIKYIDERIDKYDGNRNEI